MGYEVRLHIGTTSSFTDLEYDMTHGRSMLGVVQVDLSKPGNDECGKLLSAAIQAQKKNLPIFVEPLPMLKTESGYKVDLRTDNIIKAVGIGSALGYYTGHLWLKIPYCEDFARVAKATTCPVLLLGGESTGRPSEV